MRSAEQVWGSPRATPGRIVVIAWSLAAIAGLVVPAVLPPSERPSPVSATARTLLVVAVVTTVLIGPGLAMRVYRPRGADASLGWLMLPGGAVLVGTGLLAWVLAHRIGAGTTCQIVLGPVTVVLSGLAIASLWHRGGSLGRPDVTAIAIVLLLLLIGVARCLYSLGPPGELYGAFISRTYEATIIPDSRISYHVVQLVANGAPPFGGLAHRLFRPYTFASRGPLTGLAAAPIVLTAGARVPSSLPDQPWVPFDQQGFAAYRLAMETFAAFALLSLYSLVRRVSSSRTAVFALVLAATTPFVVHEVYFTWPKLATAGMVLLAAEQVLRRRPLRAGLLAGMSDLVHPSGLVWLPVLLILAVLVLWPQGRSNRALPVLRSWAATLAGACAVVVAWQLIVWGHSGQGRFLPYLLEAGSRLGQGFTAWVDWRLQTLADTLIPFHQLLTDSTQPYTWPPGQHARVAVRLGLGYWGTLPLGAGILFYPILVFGIGKSLLRHPYVTLGCVLLPFIGFAVYWGSVDLGLLQAGMHAWLLGTLAVYAWVRSQPGRWPARLERWILVLRVPEVAFMILFPAAWSHQRLVSVAHPATDLVALGALSVGLAGLLCILWRVADPASRVQEPTVDRVPPASDVREGAAA